MTDAIDMLPDIIRDFDGKMERDGRNIHCGEVENRKLATALVSGWYARTEKQLEEKFANGGDRIDITTAVVEAGTTLRGTISNIHQVVTEARESLEKELVGILDDFDDQIDGKRKYKGRKNEAQKLYFTLFIPETQDLQTIQSTRFDLLMAIERDGKGKVVVFFSTIEKVRENIGSKVIKI